MTRRVLFLLVAVLVTACGTARAETPEFDSDLGAYVASTAAGAVVDSDPATAYALPEGFDLASSVPTKRPEGFPVIEELSSLVASGGGTHPRARITSFLAAVDGLEVFAAEGFDTDRLDQRMTITYFDGLVIWDDPAGPRQVFVPGLGSFYRGADGAWAEATGFEWTIIGPLADWSLAQDAAALVVEAQPEVIGYEMVAGTPTVRLALIRGEDRADVWLDETGAALRIVQDFTGGDGASRWLGIWSVETLSPELTGPLPIGNEL
jgi:hypothetical protein